LKLRDVNGIYTDSAPFVATFSPIDRAPGPYQIGLEKNDSSHVTVKWTTNALNWSLESSASPEIGWLTITSPPSVLGTNFILTIATGELQQFFRLRKP
jgi:hypothetical protein